MEKLKYLMPYHVNTPWEITRYILGKLYVLLGVVFISIGLTLVISGGGNANYGSFMGYGFVRSTGSSMNPTMSSGSSFSFTYKTPFEELKVGDIIGFKDLHNINGTFVEGRTMHRIISINEDGSLITKGDGNNYIDPYKVYPKQYISRVIFTFDECKFKCLEELNEKFITGNITPIAE